MVSAQSKVDILLDCILWECERDACSLCDHFLVLTYRKMDVLLKIIGISFRRKCNIHREFVVPQDYAQGLKKHILAALYRSVALLPVIVYLQTVQCIPSWIIMTEH